MLFYSQITLKCILVFFESPVGCLLICSVWFRFALKEKLLLLLILQIEFLQQHLYGTFTFTAIWKYYPKYLSESPQYKVFTTVSDVCGLIFLTYMWISYSRCCSDIILPLSVAINRQWSSTTLFHLSSERLSGFDLSWNWIKKFGLTSPTCWLLNSLISIIPIPKE